MSSNAKLTKETIVLLPGYDGDGQETFAKLKHLLGNKYSYLVIDYPYYRQTNKAYSLSELVSFVDSKITSLNISKFHLLGFSMGGFIATSYAIEHPAKLISLTLVSSSVKPVMTGFFNLLIRVAYYSFKIPVIAQIFSTLYTSKLVKPFMKYSPLPLPRDDFPSNEGYPVFGTLANILYSTMKNRQEKLVTKHNYQKHAILFEDDLSFPASVYSPILKRSLFKVIVNQVGGHAVTPNYWNQVAESILRLFE